MSKLLRFLPEGVAAVARTRRDDEIDGGMTYRSPNGARSVLGDDNFPFFKDPPETFQPIYYVRPTTILFGTDLSDYLVGPTIDVRGMRELALYLELTLSSADPIPPAPALNGSLSLLPEALFQGSLDGAPDEVWPVGLTDLTLFEDGIPANGYSERNVFQTELIWNPAANLSPVPVLDGSFRQVLVFDVSPFSYFRFRFGCITGAALETRSYVGAVR